MAPILNFAFFISIVKFISVRGIDFSTCNNALGLESGKIKDSQLSAMPLPSPEYPAAAARLNNNSAWCPSKVAKPFLTIDLGKVMSVTALKTQGFTLPNGQGNPMESYSVAISLSGTQYLTLNGTEGIKIFKGSVDPNEVVHNQFTNAIIARYVRIFPQGAEKRDVCLRLEVLGCDEVTPLDVRLPSKGTGTLGTLTGFDCMVRAQVGVQVAWYTSSGKPVDEDRAVLLEIEKPKELQILVALVLKMNSTVQELMSGSDGFDCVAQSQKMECAAVYQCMVNYPFNQSAVVTKNITVHYSLDYPEPPNKMDITKLPGSCSFSFLIGSLGSFPQSALEYKVTLNSTGALTRYQISQTTFDYSGLKPYTLYAIDVVVSIKRDRWDSPRLTQVFHSLAQTPTVSPVITEVEPFGSKELKISWEEPKYEPGNGHVSRYWLTIEQLSYGGHALPIPGVVRIQKSIENITAEYHQYIVDGLVAWSTYKVTIFAYNNDDQFDDQGFTKSANTSEGEPSGSPQSLKTTSVGARFAELSWEEPPFLQRNGKISAYYGSVTLQSKDGSRKRRNVGAFIFIPGTSHRFVDLLPFRTYFFKIAAATSVGIGKFSAPITVTTKQAAPSIPQNVRLSRDPQDNTWIVFWDPPKEENGVISSYSLEVESEGKRQQFSVSGSITSLSSGVSAKYGLRLRIRARTIEFGDWSTWIDQAPRPYIPTEAPVVIRGSGGSYENKTGVIVGCVFLVLIMMVFFLVTGFFILYRRRYRKMARRVEAHYDKIMKPPYDNPEGKKDEHELLVRSDSIDQNTDNTGSIEDKAHPIIRVEDFHEYVRKMKENEDERFLHEYKNELMSGKRYSCEAASRPENKSKNRYANITAYDHSRVILKLDANKRKSETDYFNGNTIQGYSSESSTKYIACHGPTEGVASDFWRMVWQEGSNVIVMLTKLEEGRKVKCFQYWPAIGSLKFGHVGVTLLSTDQTADYFIRTFELCKDNERREVRQFHFVSWPDHGVPEFPTSLLSLRRRVRHYHLDSAPMIVHCSAGVGRTGCFILIDAMLERIDNDGTVDLFNYLQYMRTRRINMVQTLDQYIFAHDAVLEYILCGNTEISVIDLERRIKELKRGSGMEEEFMIVETTSPDPDTLGNIYKVLLRAGRFVDASYVDGYKQRDAFILCQSPTRDFVEDFWRVVKERKVHTIVMLNQLEENPKFCKYWPSLHDTEEVGPFCVCLTSEARNGNIMSRKLKLEDSPQYDSSFVCHPVLLPAAAERFQFSRGSRNDPDGYEVQHFQYLEWPDQGVPSRRNSLLTLMSLVEKSQQQFGNGPILVHCSNGHGRSGTFAAVYNTTERLKVEQLIDVLQCVRAIRLMVPSAVDNLEQYQFIYNMIRTFLEAFSTYSNFTQ